MSQQKKLENEYIRGLTQGCGDTSYLFKEAIKRTRGIGETLEKRILLEVKKLIIEGAKGNEG
jgi:hypothetical protein